MSDLTREEQETLYNFTAQDRIDKVLHVFSDDPVEINRLERLGLKGKRVGEFGGMEFVVDMTQYTFTGLRRKRVVSDAERARLSKQLARGVETQSQGREKAQN